MVAACRSACSPAKCRVQTSRQSAAWSTVCHGVSVPPQSKMTARTGACGTVMIHILCPAGRTACAGNDAARCSCHRRAAGCGPLPGNPRWPDISCMAPEGIRARAKGGERQMGLENVRFFRENPNGASDLEMMPNLLNFFTSNGTFLSNNHTPLIAHTAVDLLTTATGLYGDRQGMPISNSYRAYNTDGTTDPAGSFAYWTDPVFDTARTPNPRHYTNPSMVYSPTPPAPTSPPPS